MFNMSIEKFKKQYQEYNEYVKNVKNPVFFDYLNLYPITSIDYNYYNKMISKNHVNLEVAKLLKEKGFIEETYWYYLANSNEMSNYGYDFNHNKFDSEYSAPSLQHVHKWLRKDHNILIVVVPCEYHLGIQMLEYCIYNVTENDFKPVYNYCPYEEGKLEYEDVMNDAVKYVVENLI